MSRRLLFALAIGLTCLAAVLIVVLALHMQAGGEASHHRNNALIAMLPIYTAFIPIFIAARRRRGSACGQEKKNG